MKPLIVINLKTYQQGNDSLKLAKIIEQVDKNIVVGVQATDLFNISKNTNLKTYSQHVDSPQPGRNTGFILPEAVKKNGAKGIFLNHSEHRVPLEEIKLVVNRCKKLKLQTMIFAKNIVEAKKIEKLKPDYVILEPAELIAGKISISESKPELIKKIKKELKCKFLVGAGIHSKKDVDVAVKLGASGVALSSAITTAKNPKQKLKELIYGK